MVHPLGAGQFDVSFLVFTTKKDPAGPLLVSNQILEQFRKQKVARLRIE
jgi:hypothetical protein